MIRFMPTSYRPSYLRADVNSMYLQSDNNSFTREDVIALLLNGNLYSPTRCEKTKNQKVVVGETHSLTTVFRRPEFCRLSPISTCQASDIYDLSSCWGFYTIALISLFRKPIVRCPVFPSVAARRQLLGYRGKVSTRTQCFNRFCLSGRPSRSEGPRWEGPPTPHLTTQMGYLGD